MTQDGTRKHRTRVVTRTRRYYMLLTGIRWHNRSVSFNQGVTGSRPVRPTKARRSAEIEDMDKRLLNQRLEFSQLFLAIMRDSRQYELFQGFLAMIASSPSATGSIKAVIASLQELVGSGWYSLKSDEELRSLIVVSVTGFILSTLLRPIRVQEQT